MTTFERFQGRPILHHYSGKVTQTLHWNRETNELFCERSHRNTCNTYISRVASSEILDWFLDVTEHDLMEVAETGHVCLIVPAELKQEIQQIAAAENLSLGDWVIGRLFEAAHDERSGASLGQAAERRKRFKEVLKQIRVSRASVE